MILAPRGEGIESKAPVSEQTQGPSKAKKKTGVLTEYLSGFAELLKSLSSGGVSQSIDGKGTGGKGNGVGTTHMASHTKGRINSHLATGIPSVLTGENPRFSKGNAGQSTKAQTLHADRTQVEKRLLKQSWMLQGMGRGKESPGSEDVLSEQVYKETLAKGEAKDRKPSITGLGKQTGKGNVQKSLDFTIPILTEDRKKAVSRDTDPNMKNLKEMDLKKGKIQGKDSIQEKRRTEDFEQAKLEKARMVQTVLQEGKSYPEGERAKIEPNIPTFEVRLDVSGDYRRMQDLGATPVGSSAVARETVLKQLQENANPQIVQQAQLFLKNQEDGEIRLILKPEQLGEVRIRLHLQDRLIEGHITVENSTVKELFEQNKGDLAQAFREQGFEMSQMEVSVGRDSQQRDTEQAPVQFHQVNATKLAEQIPSVDRGWLDLHQLVDYYA